MRIVRAADGTVSIEGLSAGQVWDLYGGLMRSADDSDSAERDADMAFAEEISKGMEGIGER